MDTRDVVAVNREVLHIIEHDGIVSAGDGVVLDEHVACLTVFNVDGVAAGGELVAGDFDTLGFVVEVEPDVSNLATVLKHVVRDGDVVSTNLVGVVAVVVRRALHDHSNATVLERVPGNDVSVATEDTHTLVVPSNRTVEFGVAVEVREGAVGDLEEVQLVVVVVAVAHGTIHGGQT